MERFDRLIGKEQIAVFHMNDSKNIPGAAKDRHENFGFGKIGFDALMYIMTHKDFTEIPKICHNILSHSWMKHTFTYHGNFMFIRLIGFLRILRVRCGRGKAYCMMKDRQLC